MTEYNLTNQTQLEKLRSTTNRSPSPNSTPQVQRQSSQLQQQLLQLPPTNINSNQIQEEGGEEESEDIPSYLLNAEEEKADKEVEDQLSVSDMNENNEDQIKLMEGMKKKTILFS